MNISYKILLSGDEAIALGALDAGVALGAGYPGTPSTEILEYFSRLGGKAQWSPNKTAKEGTLVAEARELSRSFKLATYTVEVKDDAGDLLAVFQGMVYRKQDPVPGVCPGTA